MIAPTLFLTLALALPPTDSITTLRELKEYIAPLNGYEFYLFGDETIPPAEEGWHKLRTWHCYTLWARKAA